MTERGAKLVGDKYETVLYDEYDGMAWVTLNRPERSNAFNQTMQTELRDIWRGLRANDDVRVVVLTAAGDKAFCAGFDRKEAKVGPDQPEVYQEQQGFVGDTKYHFNDPGRNLGPKSCDLWKPVIAAVNGIACGGAFYLLGEVEFIIAADHATFFDPHVTMGRPASYEPMHMAGIMPFGDVMRMALMGSYERITAPTARLMGMVSEVVAGDELHNAALWCASRIARLPSAALEGTVRSLWAARELGGRRALDFGFAFVGLGTSDDLIAQSTAGQPDFGSAGQIEWRAR